MSEKSPRELVASAIRVVAAIAADTKIAFEWICSYFAAGKIA